ncbi:MAG TPA: HAD family phosphatase [Polyangiaceae bacterium]|nr:HAD family phosphatase [Polyangiaceae bacterium]
MFPATIFDFNGVLVDDELVHRDAFRDVLDPLGVFFTDAQYVERYLGFDDVGALSAMLIDAGRSATETEVNALAAAKRPFYMQRANRSLVVFEGAERVVQDRAKAGPVAIVSGALRDEIAFALDRMGLRDLIAFVVSAEDTTRCKPDPMGYELGIKALSERIGESAARNALVIEDSLAGIEAAKGARLPCLAVAHSYPEAELLKAGADAVVPRIRDVDDGFVVALHSRLPFGRNG